MTNYTIRSEAVSIPEDWRQLVYRNVPPEWDVQDSDDGVEWDWIESESEDAGNGLSHRSVGLTRRYVRVALREDGP